MAYDKKISCEPYVSIEDILRLVLVNAVTIIPPSSNTGLKIVKV